MWWSKRRTLLAGALAVALAGCGFTPVYGPAGAAADLRGQISIDPPRDREGFVLARRLEERLGRATAARYALSASVFLDEQGLGIRPDQTTTRFNVRGEVTFTLTDLTAGIAVTSGRVANFTAYSATGTTVATLAAQEDARARLMTILADQIVARLLATAADWRA